MAKYPDISHYHPVTDWAKAKANCPFLVSKATEGQTYVDPTLNSFISGCEANKIPYWLYTYLRKGNELKQAQFMVNTCKEKVGNCFVGYILDVEDGNTSANVKAALEWLSSLGVKTMIYTGYADYSKYKSVVSALPANCAWWEARYGKNDGEYNAKYPCHAGVDLHQYTSNGNCDGILGRCDLNRIIDKGEEWYTTPLGKTVEAAAKKSVEEIAKEVIAGKWGSGDARKQKLLAAGYNYNTIQAKVNEILNGGNYYPKYAGKSMLIDTVFKTIGVPAKFRGSWAKRKPIATANGIADYRGKVGQNLSLIALAKSGKLKKV